MNRLFKLASMAAALVGAGAAAAAPINAIDPSLLTGNEVATFDDVAGGPAPGTNYDGVFVSGGAGFAERFAGQTRTTSGVFDVLSGAPSSGLALQVGAPGQNLNIFTHNGSQVLTGLGPVGFPGFDAIGEGSFAVLFSTDQSEFGFDLVGGDGGTAFVNFYRRDGSLIDAISLGGLSDKSYAFARDGGLLDIAGISIHNDDGGGIGFDNLRFNVKSNVNVPEPGALALAGMALAAAGVVSRRRKIRT